MRLSRLVLAALLAIAVVLPAFAAPDPDHYQLTPAFLKKMDAMQKEGAKLKDDKDGDDGDSDESLDATIRRFERDPRVKPMLAKYNLTATELVVGMHAMFGAAFWVAMEPSMDKQKAAASLAGMTREQKANIALMRTYKPGK